MKYNPFIYNIPLVFGITFLIGSWYFWSLEYFLSGGILGVIGLICLGIYDYTLNVRFAKPKQYKLTKIKQVETIKVPESVTFKKKDGTKVTFKAKRIVAKPKKEVKKQ